MRKSIYLYLFNHRKEYHKNFLINKCKNIFSGKYAPSGILVANPFRLRTRRARDIRCVKTWELHQLNVVMPFGDGTHSKGGPDFAHLTFTQKSKCGGGW
jgi:hypothetical protein